MTLEFKDLVPQITKMGAMLEHLDFDLSDRLRIAYERFQAASDLGDVWARIDWVRQSDISGYRGAAPLDLPGAEAINAIVSPSAPPPSATLLAADGSQVYPDEQFPVHYYLINLAAFVYHYGVERTPEQHMVPQLFFHKDHVHDKYGRVISHRTVDDRRTIAEMHFLAEYAWAYRDEARPLLALYDNRLMYQANGGDKNENQLAFRQYMAALVRLHDAGAVVAGYIDDPRLSKRFIQLLYLMSLHDEEEVKAMQHMLGQAGDLDGLRDWQFFRMVLEPGQRSAIMVQNSPRNLEFRQRGENYEIAFFYLNTGDDYHPHIVRVDIPVWVARDQQAVDALHALLLEQCRMQGRNPYPYVLTRADELAVVNGRDRLKLDELIKAQVRRSTTLPVDQPDYSAKTRGKDLSRSDKRRFEMKPQGG